MVAGVASHQEVTGMDEHTGRNRGADHDENRASTNVRMLPIHSRDRALPGDTTVDLRTGLAILLGLIALTGSIAALCIAATIVLIGWLVSTSGDDQGASAQRHPFGGPAG
jgi:hypothetical protein